ncbi:guanylate kinase [Butyricicoccus pullicaecorum]|nr:guanylate kinase [Butyricicoccus pullicaecorum]KAG0419956.1 Guanylate kinase [Dictyocoela roeselum]OUP53773.1 guanylate kinase [Butyricicoccus pullicaecorum]OUP60762.1 guanylate kinase [Butyricicoccus pullicaecorum]HJF52559.1 guanylate kinase [Butyricicoccus pullicaecorum]
MKMNPGKLFVFTGPSGTGKGTILSQVLACEPQLRLSVSATTRQPREGEVNGVHYWFMSQAEFENKIEHDAFLEHACYVGNYYGTPEQPVNDQLAEGYDVILEIEVQGAMQIHKKRPDAIMVFVAPPSMEELSNRLHGRGTESSEKVAARLAQAETELSHQSQFDYVIVNDDLGEAIADLRAILRAERCRVVR